MAEPNSTSTSTTMEPSRRVLVAMSGGVDSSVTACLLAEAGYQVVGVFMALLKADGYSGCCSRDDKRDAQTVAERHGFKFMAVNYQEHFDELKAYFLHEYDRGRTPNPCVRCNSHLKFGELLALADKLRCQWLATGHYAQVQGGKLYRGVDHTKDQSYGLATVEPSVLERLLLPAGAYEKEEIRRLAGEHFGLSLAEKPDSQDLCFVKNDYRQVLAEHGRLTPGEFVDPQGTKLGEHSGYQQFTIGQRRGLGLGGGGRIYRVVRIEPETARVVVSDDPNDLTSRYIMLDSVHWLEAPASFPAEVEVQVRYHGESWPGIVHADGSAELFAPARAVTPGQLAAFYRNEQVLGGGFIAAHAKSRPATVPPAPRHPVPEA